jgi:hypothetical protein
MLQKKETKGVLPLLLLKVRALVYNFFRVISLGLFQRLGTWHFDTLN